jgi:thiosulfate dehydrogenase
MKSIVAYIQWLGKDVPKGQKAVGSGLVEMKWLDRPADPVAGKKLYMQKCQICHGYSGEGQRLTAKGNYIYPPLWGQNSFNTAAGLFRISNLSKYIRANMPNGSTYDSPMLSEEEAWDIAAYVVSLPRPQKTFVQDWPKIETKPVDHPFGPYADGFSEEQHKYGPFNEMLAKGKK